MHRADYSALIAAVLLLLGAVLVMPVLFEYQTVNALQKKIDTIEKDARDQGHAEGD